MGSAELHMHSASRNMRLTRCVLIMRVSSIAPPLFTNICVGWINIILGRTYCQTTRVACAVERGQQACVVAPFENGEIDLLVYEGSLRRSSIGPDDPAASTNARQPAGRWAPAGRLNAIF